MLPPGYLEALSEALGRPVLSEIIGEPGDPTRDDVRPCEYAVCESDLYPGRPAVHALIELDDDERKAIAAGARLVLRLDGGELPWSVSIADPSWWYP